MFTRLCIFFILLFIVPFNAYAQTVQVSGTITDSTGHPIPFAIVYVKGTTNGASANVQGVYTLTLPGGRYTLLFRSMGYKTQEHSIQLLHNSLVLNVTLTSNSYNLKELRVYDVDPALGIIRKTIARRAYYKKMVKDYQCRVYIKGGVLIDTVKAKLFGQVVTDTQELKRTKYLYLSESLSDYYYKSGKTKEVIIASKVSGNIPYTINTNSFLMTDFYNNTVNGILASRAFVSPIADNATYYYTYKLMGTHFEGSHKIYKIQVAPKRHNEPCFTGYVYVADSIYRLTGADLSVYKQNGTEIIDTLSYKQEFVDMNDSLWMPQQMLLHFHFKFFGIGFHGNFTGVYTQYNVNSNIPDKLFDNTLYKITDTADKKTERFWDTLRPLQLTEAEKKDYIFKDSIAMRQRSKSYMDSLDDKLYNGYKFGVFTYVSSYHKIKGTFRYTGFFNIVEGVSIATPVTFRKEWNDGRSYYIAPFVRYGLSDKKWKYGLTRIYTANPKNDAYYKLKAGIDVLPIDDDINHVFISAEDEQNIFFKQNFLKWYQKNYINYAYNRRLLRGVYINEAVEYSYRNQLFNHNTYSLIRYPGRDYAPNSITPTGDYISRQFFSLTHITLKPKEKYIEIPHQKIVVPSNWPVIDIEFKVALPGILQSNTNYSIASIALQHSLNLGLRGIFNYSASAGKFLYTTNLSYYDYKRFICTPWFIANAPLNSFGLLLPMSTYTAKQYAEAHAEYKLRGFITNKIPGFNRLKWFLVGGINGLYTPETGYYAETYVGIENILKVLSVRYYIPLQGTSYIGAWNVHLNIPIEALNTL